MILNGDLWNKLYEIPTKQNIYFSIRKKMTICHFTSKI